MLAWNNQATIHEEFVKATNEMLYEVMNQCNYRYDIIPRWQMEGTFEDGEYYIIYSFYDETDIKWYSFEAKSTENMEKFWQFYDTFYAVFMERKGTIMKEEHLKIQSRFGENGTMEDLYPNRPHEI